MNVRDMTDQQLNIALDVLLGAKVDRGRPGNVLKDNYSVSPTDYCADPAASLEVQAAACEVHPNTYIRYLEKIKWGQSTGWKVSNRVVAQLCNASPRERAEAAYMTLSSQD